MESKFIVALVGVVCITAILITCILEGIDSNLIAGGCALIGTIIGYCFSKVPLNKFKKKVEE